MSGLRSALAGIFCGALALAALPQAAAAQNLTADIMHRGTLRVAIVGGNAPYSSINPNGEPEGYDVEIAKALAASLKVKPEFSVVDSPGRITALQTGKADVAIADFTYTPERSTAVAFTEPYLIVGVRFLVQKDSPIKTVDDLNAEGRKISSPRGATSAQAATDVAPKAELVLFESVNDAFLALKSGQVDAQGVENISAERTIAQNADLRVLPGTYSYEEIGIGVPAGDFDWWRVVNSWVHQFNHSGDNARLFKKAFGSDMPPME